MRSEELQIRRLKREKAFYVILAAILFTLWIRGGVPQHSNQIPTRVFVCVTQNDAIEVKRWALNDPARANCEHSTDHTINWEVLP